MYKIRGSDGKDYGPISTEVLRQWIAERRVIGTTLAQAEGSTEWKPLSTFPEFAAVFPPPATPAPPPAASYITGSGQPAPTSGMAISSLVLGICGMFTCGISALVGLILGIVSLGKIKKSNGTIGGKGLAIAGICVSGLFLLIFPAYLALNAALLLPALQKAKSKAATINCVSNLKQMGLAARMYANNNKDRFPLNFISMSNELGTPKILTCNDDHVRTKMQSWADFNPTNVTYQFLAPGLIDDATNYSVAVFQCPIHGNVCYADGSVQQGQSSQSGSRWNSK
jgi:hypothetical protein